MRKLIACAVGLVAALALTVPGALGGAGPTPGVTAKSITIGGTFPLTGPAASYAPIPLGMKAYFSYVNARREGRIRRSAASSAARSSGSTTTTATTPRTRRSSHGGSSSRTRCSRPSAQLGTEPQARGARVPEPAEGAAGARLDGGHGVRARSSRSTRGRSAGSPTTSPRAACTGCTSRRTQTARRSASSTRTTTTARTTCTGSAPRSEDLRGREHRRSGGDRADRDQRGLADDEDQGERRDRCSPCSSSRRRPCGRSRPARRSASTPTRST